MNARFILPNTSKSIGRQIVERSAKDTLKKVSLDLKYIHYQKKIEKEEKRSHPDERLIKFYEKLRDLGE
jgi:hypothetical protein